MRGFKYCSSRRLRIEPRNVHGDAAVEQLDVLRQIADMLAERVRRPVIERSVVELSGRERMATPRPSARAMVDLPELGPMIPTACPLRS